MKILRNRVKNKVLFVLLVIFTLSIFFFATSLNRKSVKADVITTTDYEDRFSDRELSGNWTVINDTQEDVELLEVQDEALVFSADFNAFLSQVCYKPYTMTGPCKVEFISICESSSNGYLAFSAGNKNAGLGMPYASAAFIMAPTYAHIFVKTGDAIAVVEKHVQYYSPLMQAHFGEPVKTTFDFQATATANYYDIVYTVETMDGTQLGTYTYEDILIENGYLGFNSQYSRVGVTSFKVYENGEEKVNCDFTDSAVLYPTTGSSDSDWVACSFDEKSLKVGAIAMLDVSRAGTGAVYNTKYERPLTTQLETLYSLSVDVKTATMGVGVATGFEIGKAEKTAQGTFAGLTKDDGGRYYLVSFDGLKQNRVAVDESSVDGMTMTLDVYYDNTAVISLGNTSLQFSCSVVEGYFALTTVDFYGGFEGQLGAKLDNFVYERNSYKASQGKDIGINFQGTKTTYEAAAEAYFTDYYIHEKDWRMSADVIETRYSDPVEGEEEIDNKVMVVSRNYANTWFGPNAKYENFIVRFDATILRDATYEQQPIFGLQFGMAKTDSTVEQSVFLGFESFQGQSYVVSQSAKLSTGNGSEPLTAGYENIFQKNKTYNVMYVATNGNVKVYLKEASRPESDFEILRGEINGVDTQGYLQVLAMGNVRFDLDNFSIVNLDYNTTSSTYNGNGYEILRADFAMGDTLNGFTLKNAEYKDTSLSIKEGGYLLSKDALQNEIFRFKTKATTGDVVFEQGELKIYFAASGDKIVVAHNKKIREFALEEKIDFDGALLEVYKMGNSVVIGYVNQNQPVSCMRNYQYSVLADNIFEEEIKLYAKEGSLELYSLSTFDLKPTIAIETRNYDASLDYTNPWPLKPLPPELQTEDTKKGCGSEIASTAGILFLAVALATIFVIRRRKDEKSN